MKKLKKALILLLCAALLVGASIAGTVAYLTSTQTVKNTFTVGDIEIKLDEAVVDEEGQAVTGDNAGRTTDGNTYHLQPNLTYDKDPTVWVKEGSEEAYIRMIVTVSNYDKMLQAFESDATYDDDYIVGEMVVLDKLVDRNSSAWEFVEFEKNSTTVTEDGETTTLVTGTYIFNYYPGAYKVPAGDEEYVALPALFTTITVPKEIDNAHLAYLNDTTVTVTAQAIQTAGFTSVEKAWEAFPAN